MRRSNLADLVTPMSIRVAATLRLADHLAEGRKTAASLARLTNADTHALERLLRHLVAVDFFEIDKDDCYALTDASEELRDDHPSGLRASLDIHRQLGRAELSFVHLLHSIETGESAFEPLYGLRFWDDLGADAERTATYDEQMGIDVARWAGLLVPAYDWGALGHIVDVGGGNGTLLAAILSANPTLRGTVLDQPATAATATATLRDAGLASRSDVVAGSFFEALPSGAGAYLLCAVLHDWDDSAARSILVRCREAATQAGRVFVVEKTGADGESPRTDMDLRMLAFFGARERGVGAIQELGAAAGLVCVALHPAGELSIVEFRPSGGD